MTAVRSMIMIGVAALVGACAAPKPPDAFEKAYDDEQTPWVEVVTQLPPKPVAENLIDIAVSGATSYRFSVDTYALSIGSDGVYRYTLVATSPSGARNVSYEGIRCDTNQKKIYAIGRADGTWVRSRNATWTTIEEVGLNRQHAALEKEYFCPTGFDAQTVKQIVARMKPRLAPSEALYDLDSKAINR